MDQKKDILAEASQLCTIHTERMQFAWGKVYKHFPLDANTYLQLKPEELSFIDQLIFRFSKLQDSMGGKLFPAILENLEEDVKGVSFIDRLGKLEELEVIPDANDWIMLRETRNIVTHDYPFNIDDIVQGLNLLSKHYLLIVQIWNQVQAYIKNRFKV